MGKESEEAWISVKINSFLLKKKKTNAEPETHTRALNTEERCSPLQMHQHRTNDSSLHEEQ